MGKCYNDTITLAVYVNIHSDECTITGDNNCSTDAVCTNSPGGFTCSASSLESKLVLFHEIG